MPEQFKKRILSFLFIIMDIIRWFLWKAESSHVRTKM